MGTPSIISRGYSAFWCGIGIDASIAASDGRWGSGAWPRGVVGECIWGRNLIRSGKLLVFERQTWCCLLTIGGGNRGYGEGEVDLG